MKIILEKGSAPVFSGYWPNRGLPERNYNGPKKHKENKSVGK